MDDTPELNRHWRARIASFSKLAHPDDSLGKQHFAQNNHNILMEHAPEAGPAPQCKGCGASWPCEMAEAAMRMVGVWS
jgi:hypothetical protein